MHYFVDDQMVGSLEPPIEGFWELSRFNDTVDNPWINGTSMAPFDREVTIYIKKLLQF
jgi:hypothetical protein